MSQKSFNVSNFQLDKFFEQIIDVYGGDINNAGLMGLWNETMKIAPTVIPPVIVGNGLCTVILQRGPRKGEACGKKQAKMCEYCSAHAKAKGVSTTPSSTSSSKSSASSTKSVTLKLALHKTLKCYWDPITTLAYEKAGTSKVCIGFVKDDELYELEEEQIHLCRSNDIKIKE
jgi:hypothetical protein